MVSVFPRSVLYKGEMFRERRTAMMATLVSGCVWKRIQSVLVLHSVFFAVAASNGTLEAL